jgi:Tfp pilus assembly protein PilP
MRSLLTRVSRTQITCALLASGFPLTGAAQFDAALNDFMKLRDPFKMPAKVAPQGTPKSELELIPIESFKVIGVTTGPDRAKAMLQAQDGRTFFVTEKTKIGLSGGVIEKISSRSVQVKEKKMNAVGQEEESAYEIKFPTSKGM